MAFDTRFLDVSNHETGGLDSGVALLNMVSVISEHPTGSALIAVHNGVGPDQPPLVCVHSAHGNVAFLEQLAKRTPSFAIWGVQAAPVVPIGTTVTGLAEQYLELLDTVMPTGPVRIAGYCAGAGIAHEMARQLQEKGRLVSLVGILDVEAPTPEQPHHSKLTDDELARKKIVELRRNLAEAGQGEEHADLVKYLRATDSIEGDVDPAGLEEHFLRWTRLMRISAAHTPRPGPEMSLLVLTPRTTKAGQGEALTRHWAPEGTTAAVLELKGASGMLYRTRSFREALESALSTQDRSVGETPQMPD